MNFTELVTKHASKFESIESDLLDLFTYHYGNDELENLKSYDVYDRLDYSGGVHELIDGSIDIYYHDIREWSVDNYEHIEEANEEGLNEGVTDFHRIIQGGQYVYYRNYYNEQLEKMTDIINELVDEQGA